MLLWRKKHIYASGYCLYTKYLDRQASAKYFNSVDLGQGLPCLPLIQGPVVQSTVSLTSSLVVKMSTFLVNTISYSQVFLLKKCE